MMYIAANNKVHKSPYLDSNEHKVDVDRNII